MTDIETIGRLLDSPDWSDAEKSVIKWQFRLYGHFYTALWDAIKLADENNLIRLEKGFPLEVYGFKLWSQGGLGKRLRAAGLDI